jgi:hypothetical protein
LISNLTREDEGKVMNDPVVTAEWLRQSAVLNIQVGVVDRSGVLVNVGWLSESGDRRKVMFSSESPSGVFDVWLAEAGEPDEFDFKIVPMTPDREERWKLIQTCSREIAWSRLSNYKLEEILKIARRVGDEE